MAVLLALGEEDVHVAKDLRERHAEALVSGIRAVRDPGVHDGNTRSEFARNAEKVGPEFCFGEDDQLGAEQSDVGSERERKIQREEKDVGIAEFFASEFLSGGGRSGNNDAPAL